MGIDDKQYSGSSINPESLDFKHQRVLVTGAAGGIGGAMAHAFHAHGATVLLADKDKLGLESLAGKLERCEVHEFDQRSADSIAGLADAAGTVHVLLNNAGILRTGPLLDASFTDIEDVITTNLIGPMLLLQTIARGMVERGHGVIVNTASQLAFTGAATRSIYATAKAGLVQFTRSTAAELGPLGVRVVALAPGRTRTALNAHLLADEEELAWSLQRIPSRRLGEAEEMARLALILASPIADYVVGETLIADGGYVLE